MKRLYKILGYVLSIGLLFFACKKETSEAVFLNLDEEELTMLQQPFIHLAGNRMVPLNTNLDVVKVSSSADWCKVSIVDNNGAFLRVDVFPNEGFDERTAEVTVFGQGVESIKIPVTQWSSEPLLVVAESAGIDIIDGELDFTLHITSNVDFTLELPVWITSVGNNTPFIGSKLYTFIASPIAPGDRVGYIKVITDEHPDLDQIIEVSQHQNILQPVLSDFSPLSGEKESTVVLNGSNFGTNKDLIKVYFNTLEAEVVSVADDAITVIVPRAPGNPCTIKVDILGEELTYPTTFDYVKSWGLYTVTGDGNATFRGGTLAQGRLRARYISLDGNGNIFASHRDEGNNRYIVRINEAENKVEALGASMGNGWQPNGTTVGLNNVVYLANDAKNGRSYYELDPANNWTPVEQTITYGGEAPPSATAYLYRLIYNFSDGYLYGVIGHADGTVIKVNPSTREGEVIYRYGQHPTWYGLAVNPGNGTDLYAMVNTQAVGYGPYRMNLTTASAGFTRLNPLGNAGAATPALLNDGPLQNAGFGQAWDLTFGPDGYLYVSDFTNHVIRRINLTTNTVETVIGQAGVSGNVDGKKDKARLYGPRGLAWNQDGTALYIFDFNSSNTDNTNGNRLRKWTLD